MKEQSMIKVLEMFSAITQIACSMEGDPKHARKSLTFPFQDKDGCVVPVTSVTCEPHTKLEKTGKKGDAQYRFDRIYFHPGIETVALGKVLVGHIGKHL